LENVIRMESCVYVERIMLISYKGQVIFDPWMNEKSKGLLWPDHESKESLVNPVEYYGQKTIEDYAVNLFMFRPEWASNITEKIKRNLNEYGRLVIW